MFGLGINLWRSSADPDGDAGGGDTAVVYRSTSTTTTGTGVVSWDQELTDAGDFHDPAADSRLSPAPGLVRLSARHRSTNTSSVLSFIKNGASFPGTTNLANKGNLAASQSAIVSAAANDYFEAKNALTQITGGATGSTSWFAVETLPASTKHAIAQRAGNLAMSAGTNYTVDFDSELTDTDGFHDNATNPSRLTVPAGVSLVRVSCSLDLNVTTTGSSSQILADLMKNGSPEVVGLSAASYSFTPGAHPQLVSAILPVVAGDYFQTRIFTSAANSLLAVDATWFQIEAVPTDTVYALVGKSADQTVGVGPTKVTFNTESVDASGMHDNATNNTRLTVPPGVTQARLSFSIVKNGLNGVNMGVEVHKNNAHAVGMPSAYADPYFTNYASAMGAWVDVVPGDYFEVVTESASASAVVLGHLRTWFQMECR